MLRKIKQIFRLSRKEKLLFIEAYGTLAVYRFALLLFPFERLTQSLTQEKCKNRIALLPFTTMQTGLLVSKAICRAANNTPWESACLVQALSARWMLQRRGIPGVFFLGVMKDKTAKEQMKAHAWTEAGEKILTGGAGYEQYSVIAVYKWEKKQQ